GAAQLGADRARAIGPRRAGLVGGGVGTFQGPTVGGVACHLGLRIYFATRRKQMEFRVNQRAGFSRFFAARRRAARSVATRARSPRVRAIPPSFSFEPSTS